jgi:hypothetical protein
MSDSERDPGKALSESDKLPGLIIEQNDMQLHITHENAANEGVFSNELPYPRDPGRPVVDPPNK